MRLTILVVSGGGFQGQGLIQVARRAGDVRIIVADTLAPNIGQLLADRYVTVPPLSDDAAFAGAIEDLVRTERVRMVFPSTDRELQALARAKDRIEVLGAQVAVSALALLELLADKRSTYQTLMAEGIPVQRPLRPDKTSPYPLLGKPRGGWGGRGFRTLHGWDDLAKCNGSITPDDYCWVPRLETFDEYSADFAVGFAGNISPITLRRRRRTSSGFAVVSDSVDDPSLQAICAQVAQWLARRGGCGIFNVQVLRLPDGTCFVSDINARHGTSSGHAAAEGNNLVGFMADASIERPRTTVRTVRLLEQRSIPLPAADDIPAYRGVVFDLDDTLIDHKRWIMQKMRLVSSALAPRIAPSRLLEQAYAAVEEGCYEQLIDRIIDRLGFPDLHADLLQAYRDAKPEHAPVFDDVQDVLLALRQANIRIGLLTDNPPESQKIKLAAMRHVSAMLDAVVFTREQGAEKPAIVGFHIVAEQLGLPRESLLMVGDNVARDAAGAIAAGYAGCMLLNRIGGRFHVHESLFASCWPQLAARTWTSPDLRALPIACGITV